MVWYWDMILSLSLSTKGRHALMEGSANYSAVGKEPALHNPRTLRGKTEHSVVVIVTPELGGGDRWFSVQATYSTW